MWERAAPCPMTFWVGRWVAANRVTAGARPSPAIVSVSLIAAGASSANAGPVRDRLRVREIDDGEGRRLVAYRAPGAAGRHFVIGYADLDTTRLSSGPARCV